ncbi:MAG: hypothetical protein K5766_02375 [Alphaproteobacteria bacterium]|nr:hypothetical protein [Alphaproteobacteria bacterium]
MKIAVQLYGHLRTYKRCFSALKRHLLDKYDCDIFMHTWDTVDHNTPTWHEYCSQNAMKKIEEKEIIPLYHPKLLKIENQPLKDLGVLIANKNQISIFGIQSMFYSMKSVNGLRQKYEKDKNIQYDFVIFIRPDILLLEDFDIESFIKNYTQKELTARVFHAGKLRATNFDFEWIVGEDTLFFLKPQAADSLFSDLDNLYRYSREQPVIPYGPEYFLIQEEEKRNLKPVLLQYFWEQHFDILRFFSWRILRRQLISIRLKEKKLKISLLSFFNYIFLRWEFSLFGFVVCFLIGRERI